MVVINHNELGKFTHEELSNFTHTQLALGELELLAETNHDLKLPAEIVDKLYQLCDEIMIQFADFSIDLPLEKKDLTLQDTLRILNSVMSFSDFDLKAAFIIQAIYIYFVK